jgi:signal transduction histidine kinase
MYRQLRIYRIASLAIIVVAAALLVLLYRAVAVEEIIRLTQSSNLALTHTALNAVKPELVEYLSAVEHLEATQVADNLLPGRLGSVIAGMMRDTSVARIKIYNHRGVVVYSTKSEQTGSPQEDNGGFESAIMGRVVSKLVYRGTLDFSRATEDDNLMSTYIPVQKSANDPVLGVFEVYADVANLVLQNERAVITIFVGIGMIFAFLYLALLFVAERAAHAIEVREAAVNERSASLEAFYAQLLKGEEMAKTEIAAGLQKALTQTLDAADILLRRCREEGLSVSADASPGPRESMIDALAGIVPQIRSIAAGLRRSRSDEYGLRPAVDLFCREFEHLYPGNLIEQQVPAPHSGAPARQKIIMYRVLESAFKNIAQFADADQIQIMLRRSDGADALATDGVAPVTPDAGRPAGLAHVLGRMASHGGIFSVRRTDAGEIMLRASWTK